MKINQTLTTIPPQARLWFYNIPRELSNDEILKFEELRGQFLPEWNTHGKSNHGDVWLIENRLLMVIGWNDFESISGCSIDKSVAFIRSLSALFEVDLMDRMWVYFQKENEVQIPRQLKKQTWFAWKYVQLGNSKTHPQSNK